MDFLKILLFSGIAILYLFAISKLLGKKQIAQLDVLDYMLGIAVSSIAAEMATDLSETPFYYYLVAMSVFFLINLLIVFLERKGPTLKNFLKGKPLTVIYEGKINYQALKKSKMDVNDLIAKCREKNYFDLNDIAYAIFENSGMLSILPKGEQKPAVAADLAIPIKPAKLPFYLIDDGHISYSSLRTLKKSETWLLDRLNIHSKEDLKNIILATYDEEKDEIVTSKKN